MSKPIWHSRTAWFNTALAGLSATLAALEIVMGAGVPLSLTTAAGALAAGINIYLRLTTATAIRPIIIRGNVQHIGGVEFDGPATITGAVAGGSIGSTTVNPGEKTP